MNSLNTGRIPVVPVSPEPNSKSVTAGNLSMEILTSVGGVSNTDFDCTIRTLRTISKLANKYPISIESISDSQCSLNRLIFPLKTLLQKLIRPQLPRNVRRRRNRQLFESPIPTLDNSENNDHLSADIGSSRKHRNNFHAIQCKLENSGIRKLREVKAAQLQKVFLDPSTCTVFDSINKKQRNPILGPKQNCYVCKSSYSILHESHHFYDKLCLKCAKFNYIKRTQKANLHGKIALVTGGRIKIGYEVCLQLLRCGATVIVTTRFPKDAYLRYSHERDFQVWKDSLHIYGLDLRFLRDVENFCCFISRTYNRLDILIQNACQTIHRPIAFYQHLLQRELSSESFPQVKSWDNSKFLAEAPTAALCNVQCSPALNSAQASQLCIHSEDVITENTYKLFPVGVYDNDHQQVDLRTTNSWILEADQVETSELIEVNLINSIAPFIILSKLTPILKASVGKEGNPYGWIILVSSMEGKFNRFKNTQHPHTNCAKASLNMLARTSGPYYREFGLLMNAVDTGWVTDEDPVPVQQERKRKFHPPLDEIDGAARILDPIFQTLNHNIIESGVFYKDYKPSTW